ncbi:hypothetical protein MKZ38_005499 [Zalerion maritima]|uniref:SH3 domain-containing protein n=1 Tax=Zalerion maritima TaxID=339359 RepID=A0AAD5RXW6_9PEZI|nr:hypothetical protein MKZ38_005499 [Zalerion maritima]
MPRRVDNDDRAEPSVTTEFNHLDLPQPRQLGDDASSATTTTIMTRQLATQPRRAPSDDRPGRLKPSAAPFRTRTNLRSLALALLSVAPAAMADCISLEGSSGCSAFSDASVSTDSFVVGLFPFMSYVSSTDTFDEQLSSYVQTSYVQEKYQTLLGCQNIDLTNTTNLYARFTTTVICNAIIQNSIDACSLTSDESRPVCAETCYLQAQFAQSEALVVSDNQTCSGPYGTYGTQVRADFTNCALPANSLNSANCITGISNEPDNCGFGNSTIGLCSHCAAGGINSTDTCCYNSDIDNRCAGVVLPTITPTMSFDPDPTATGATGPDDEDDDNGGLSGGAIAGIVAGAVAGVALIASAVFFIIRWSKRKDGSQTDSVLNQPSPARMGRPPSTAMSQKGHASSPSGTGYEVLPGGRIARMSALEGHSGDSPSRHAALEGGAAAGAAVGYAAARSRRGDDHSSSDGYGDSPESERAGVLRPPPTNIRRTGSLSSGSMLAGDDPQSPGSAGGMSSPQGIASQQSEQLPFFKDYYSSDDVHPGDRVAVLWAYQPRAADEFALERGDMLKVVGIWDDGWATGVLMDENTEDWEVRRQAQRDSGVSNTSGRRDESPPVSGEIKAFPLVCVCLPEHWRKTIEGDGSTESSGQSTRPRT